MKPITNIHINPGQAGLIDCSRIYPLVERVKRKINKEKSKQTKKQKKKKNKKKN